MSAENTSTTNDALLVQLGRRARELEVQLNELAKGDRDLDDTPGYAEADEEHGNVLREMLALPARTVEGLRAKAERIIEWRKEFPADMLDGDMDVRLGVSIARDLVAMTAE